MSDTDEVTVERIIDASPDAVFALVSDVTRMGEWSPEATSAMWIGGSDGPAVGARFKGMNARGDRNWSTTCKVVECDSGRAFAFEVSGGGLSVARWSYRFAPHPDGCTVTETWTDQRGWLVRALGKRMTGVTDRASHNRATMTATLEALATAAVAGAAGPSAQ